MKRIAGSYVYWYNLKYKRSGHLFGDRFKSEPVEDDGYFLTVLRYIHQNPVKGGLSNSVHEYEYSSYNDYLEESNELVDIDFVFSMMSRESFVKFHHEKNDDKCMDFDERDFRLNDADAR